jgi:hypothetical protein
LQLVEILTVTSDGAVPVAHRLADGATEDSTWHRDTWDQLVDIVGSPGFTYVADCKLATRDNMDHIARNHGRFLTILPRTRKEDETGRAWIASGGVTWAEIARQPAKRKDDPDQVYWSAEAPSPSAEGYRVVWIRSSDKRARDQESRRQRIERALTAIRTLEEALASQRCRLKPATAVEEAAAEIIQQAAAGRWVNAKITDTVAYEHRQESRGRPGKNTRYRRIERRRFSVATEVDHDAVAYDAASDGCFPMVTNEELPHAELLRIYKFQPRLERRHATFKGVIEAAPLTLKSDARLDALGFCLYAALLDDRIPTLCLRQRPVRPRRAAAHPRGRLRRGIDQAAVCPWRWAKLALLGHRSRWRLDRRMAVLARRPGGSVVATDLDTTHLEALTHHNLEIWVHDVTHDDLPEAEFDLVHLRLVLAWLPQPPGHRGADRASPQAGWLAARRGVGLCLCGDRTWVR